MDYNDYLELQKEKTTDPTRRAKWLNEEWNLKLDGFKNIFVKNQRYIGTDCLCIGARTGQEVQALRDRGKEAIGIDLVSCEPLVIEGDFHNLEFKDCSFDFVFSNVFDHALYPDKFCFEIFRTLRFGGYALLHLQVNHPDDKYGVHDVKDIKQDFLNHLPKGLNLHSLHSVFYPEFATFNAEAVLKKEESSDA